MTRIFRFAPSPNGELHLGHARSALLNQRLASESGGRLLLRIEDIDVGRCTPEFEAAIYRDLEWLGVTWESPARRQSEHFDDYQAALDRLKSLGLVYPSFMSRGEMRDHIAARSDARNPWPRDPDGAPLYPDADRRLSRRERTRRIASHAPHAWRLDMQAASELAGDRLSWQESGEGPGGEAGAVPAKPEIWGDVVIARSDIPASYHLAVTVDDALQGVTDVVRGQDLFYACAVHRLLQHLLDLPAPDYRHHALIVGADGRKLSKSRGDTGIAALRESGHTAEEVRAMALEGLE
ncbi:MAG: tRNA glutamyl-Q(34) synthetase GluQRS [Mesorhizobium sp.]|nr:tRNA glutamyl-Q(34) synthetase GluQRS [Mesorhizobium sp.]